MDDVDIGDGRDRFQFRDVLGPLEKDLWLTFTRLGEKHLAAHIHQRISRERVERMVAFPPGIQCMQIGQTYCYDRVDRFRQAQAHVDHFHMIQWYGTYPGHIRAPAVD